MKEENTTALRKFLVFVTALLLVIFAIYLGMNVHRRTRSLNRTVVAMDTVVRLKMKSHKLSDEELSAIADSVMRLFMHYDSLLNIHSESSELSRLNRSADTLVSVSPALAEVIDSALKMRDASGGAFEPAIAPISLLWHIADNPGHIPPSDSIEDMLQAVERGCRAHIIGDSLIFKPVGVRFDLGGITKGFVSGKAMELLHRHFGRGELSSYLLDAGHSILGERTSGKPFKIGITHPRLKNRLFGTFELPSGSCCASAGDYERFFILDGVRYHHIFNPKTGYPAREAIAATVLGSDPARIDAISTALFVLGPKDGISLLDSFPDIEGIVIYQDGDSLAVATTEKMKVVFALNDSL